MSRPVDRAAGTGAGPAEMPYLPETATGQITAAGQVGTVAGIQRKMVAAGAAGARPGPGRRAAADHRLPDGTNLTVWNTRTGAGDLRAP